MREARLRPEFAHLYPELIPGQWEPASRIAEVVLARFLLQQMGSDPRERAMQESHFEFQGGAQDPPRPNPRRRVEDRGEEREPALPAHSESRQASARDRLIVALDLNSPDENRRLVERLGPAVSFYKLGWGVLLRPGGTRLMEDLLRDGRQVFLDLKFFDVPNSVGVAVSAATALGVRFVTVHGNREIVAAAARARGDSALKILAVTVLTSLSEAETRRMCGMPDGVALEEHVARVAREFVESGSDGVIASPREVAAIRGSVGQRAVIITPGIRMSGESPDDQKRTGTPYESIVAGSDYLVVGRSVYQNPDPVSQAERYVEEIRKGLADRLK